MSNTTGDKAVRNRQYTGKVDKSKYEHSLDRFIECFDDLVKAEKANDILKALLAAYSVDLHKANERIAELQSAKSSEFIVTQGDLPLNPSIGDTVTFKANQTRTGADSEASQ